jgi:4-alpha-glucanotransferase
LKPTILFRNLTDSRRFQPLRAGSVPMDLFTKAAELGIQTEFFDGQGRRHATDAAALKIIIDAMPVRVPRRFLGGPVVVRSGEITRTELSDAATFPLHWNIALDSKVVAAGTAHQRSVEWPADLGVGSYRLHVTDASHFSEQAPFIVAPPKAFHGDFDRSWILAVQLYSVRSARNWGMGDFTDLAQLIELAAGLGAGGIGLNPLHALFDDRPSDCSPYSPNSRLFLNALYIDVEQLPEFSADGLSEDADNLLRLRASDVVDYAAVAALKWRALRSAFEAFKAGAKPSRRAAFARFRALRGTMLSRFACFEVLRHRFNQPWWEWPAEWQQPDDAKTPALQAGPDGPEIEFVEFVQWCADQQLRSCRKLAARRGMQVGLYLDVAVGVQADGFDAWNEQVAISRHLAVGAPPDPLNTAGQNWGLAGFNAAGLEVQDFEPFRDMLKASMRYAGAIRLDHVLGLKRLYLVPHGFAANNGAYVQMPFEALLAATAQESVANRCVVIGEDLGTVPEGFREQLASWGIWSYLVMMFERDPHGSFQGLDHYAPNALVTFNTHDLPTFAGWRTCGDLELKRSLGIDPGETDESRKQAIAMLSDALRRHAIDNDNLYAVAHFLSRTRSRLLALSLEDLLNVADQPNIPGTVDEHPNWRQRLPVAIDGIIAAIDVDALKDATGERLAKGAA